MAPTPPAAFTEGAARTLIIVTTPDGIQNYAQAGEVPLHPLRPRLVAGFLRRRRVLWTCVANGAEKCRVIVRRFAELCGAVVRSSAELWGVCVELRPPPPPLHTEIA